MKPAVFIDRDGTILDEMGYVVPGSEIKIYDFSAPAIVKLAKAGFPVVVVTNQGGIALGMYDHAFVDRTHASLAETLAKDGAEITAWYYCPHHPEGKVPEFTQVCECRKPGTAMLESAARDLDLDLSRSWVVGDQWRDIELARRAGANGILVRTGYGAGLEKEWPSGIARPPVVCDDLMTAADHILNATT
jgi:D-glycero-D-manno-heptose 1,7-bisphosphate phosphatase